MGRRDDDLDQPAVHDSENRTERPVAPHDLLQTLLQGAFVQRPANAKKERVIVYRTL